MKEIAVLHLLELSESVHKFKTIKIIKISEMKLFVNALRKYGAQMFISKIEKLNFATLIYGHIALLISSFNECNIFTTQN